MNLKKSSHFNIEELYSVFGVKISSLSRRMLQNKTLAEEAAQEVWLEITKSIPNFKGNSSISTWIFTIARRTLMRYAKNERVYKQHEINGHFEREEISYPGSEEEKEDWIKEKCDWCLTAFCHCLTDDARLIFIFREIAELPYSQIADIMEIEETSIRQIISRSRKKVTNFMNKNCILFNTQGECKCRIQHVIKDIEYQKLYNSIAGTAKLAKFYKLFEKRLPRKNFWEKYFTQTVTIEEISPLK